MLDLINLESYYGRSKALNGITLSIPKGEITGIAGRNGTGKTTLLKTIMGLTDDSSGTIRLADKDLITCPTHERALSGIAYVPQGRGIIPEFTVRENILMGAFAHREGKRSIPEIVPELFPYLADNMSRPGGVLSGGQQQQLAIARALAAEPDVVLLDEPNEGIQPSIVEEIEAVILRMKDDLGLTVVLVEQNIGFLRRAASSFAMLEKGRVVEAGQIAALSDEMVERHMTI
ncbi:urea ABC transporter ATP-binding subunit UrtE [Celeribacter sp. PS-C1]|uniref:urea ABC transporter ATP-binding subunit UrtE n=1 Tax=Celeribacter sp. PS-C1 TaxID=2820813 RepID=UPI001CA5BF8C|nr:urea ABC transporter ATP-binding subunit UrtE [Celeribacter sp. PS-C1]MBW6418773.1 urea ABC transporter ATP-binding subunit UrtE [Celeribacter sp. PS-C1]